MPTRRTVLGYAAAAPAAMPARALADVEDCETFMNTPIGRGRVYEGSDDFVLASPGLPDTHRIRVPIVNPDRSNVAFELMMLGLPVTAAAAGRLVLDPTGHNFEITVAGTTLIDGPAQQWTREDIQAGVPRPDFWFDLTAEDTNIMLWPPSDIGVAVMDRLRQGTAPEDVRVTLTGPAGGVVSTPLPPKLSSQNIAEAGRIVFSRTGEINSQVASGQCKLPVQSPCFLTTACCTHFGKADDCWELTTLRRFRDGWLARQPDGRAWIDLYYRTAPAVLARGAPLSLLYWRFILPSAICARLGLHRTAFRIYTAMMRKLGVLADPAA